MKRRSQKYFLIEKMQKMATNLTGCIEFPHFGARYPDATCADGYLWDLDSSDDIDGAVFLTSGGEDPCPVCRTKQYIKDMLDNEVAITRIFKHLTFLFERYGRYR